MLCELDPKTLSQNGYGVPQLRIDAPRFKSSTSCHFSKPRGGKHPNLTKTGFNQIDLNALNSITAFPIRERLCAQCACAPVRLGASAPLRLCACAPVRLGACAPVRLGTWAPGRLCASWRIWRIQASILKVSKLGFPQLSACAHSEPVHLCAWAPGRLCAWAPGRLCACVPVRLCACAPVRLCPFAPVRLCACAPVRLSACAPLRLSICAPVRLCACAPVLLCACAPVRLSASVPVHLGT